MPKTIFVCKPSNLDDVEHEIAFNNYEPQSYYVAEQLELSDQDFANLTTSFLADRDCFREFSYQRHLRFLDTGVPCIRVISPSSQIALIINTEGYDYARYVGIE